MLKSRIAVIFVFASVLLSLFGASAALTPRPKTTTLANSLPTVQTTSSTNESAPVTAQNMTTASSLLPSQTATTISLSATPNNVRLQDKSTLAGTLVANDMSTDPPGPPTPLPNQTIEIQQLSSTNTWTAIASVTTNESGEFAFMITIATSSTQFRAVYAGDTSYAPSTTDAVTVTGFKATTKIQLTSPTKVTAETLTTYYAHFNVYDSRMTTKPPIVGAIVDVYSKDAFGSGSWKKFLTATTNSAGNISWRAKVSTPTYWKLLGHGTATSEAVYSAIYKPQVVPIGKIFKLPSTAPKPTALAPQPAAVGSGAHPYVSHIPDSVWKNMVGKSWHSGCPVGRSGLLYMTINYWGFDGYRHRGELVFRASHKSEFVKAFTWMYNKRIPLHGMYRVDKFGYSSRTHGADDYASMQHDNTSAFNCRWVDGRPGVTSPHAYGTAVDINPYENPYHSAKGWTPNYWWRAHHVKPYTWRTRSDTQVYIMTHSGFRWTYGNEDSQHFDA